MGTKYKIKFSDDVVFNNYDSGKIRDFEFLKSRIYNTVGSIIKDLEELKIPYTDYWVTDIREYFLNRISKCKTAQELVDFIVAMRFICINQYRSLYDRPIVYSIIVPNEEWEIGYDGIKRIFWNTVFNLILERNSLHHVCLVQYCNYKGEQLARSYIGKPYETYHIFDYQDVRKSEKYKKHFLKKKASKENKKEE